MPELRCKAALLLGLACAWPIASARAEEPEIITVHSSDCADLRMDELQRLLNLELALGSGPSDPRPRSLALRVRCADDRIELRVVDPKTGNDLARSIPAPARDEPGRERVIALAVSELFSSAWLDLLSAPEPTPEVYEPPPSEPPSPPVASPPPPVQRRDAIVVQAGIRVRRLQTPMPMGALAVGYGGWLHPSWGLFGGVALEYGGRPTPLGSVHAIVVGPHLRGAYRSRASRRVRALASLGAALDYLRLQGVPDQPGVQAGSAQALSADVFASVGIAIDLRRGWLEIPLQGGFLVPGPRGRVSGHDPVRTDGGWIGIAIAWAIRLHAVGDRAEIAHLAGM